MNIIVKSTVNDAIKFSIFKDALNSGYALNKIRYRKAIDWIFDSKNEETVKEASSNTIFDFPDYWEMDQKISDKLSTDEVDLIQHLGSDLKGYFAELDCFGFKKPKKNAMKVVKVKITEDDFKDCPAVKMMFVNYWDIREIETD